jgi:H/ACA ribonucleoprotein complex subunit 4
MTKELPFKEIEREQLVKREAKTSEKYGFFPEKRPVEQIIDYGIVNIDKPRGPTSHQVSSYVQKILNIKKSGHSGTLDPNVTGVLPVALGSATRISQALLYAGKEYVCIMHLHKPVEEDKIRKVCSGFIGKIKQLPPIKSAIKRQERYRKIYYLEILEIIGQDVMFKVGCQAGTYIRKLCHDIGQKLGVGAHMSELRRTKAGPFDETTTFTLQDLQDAYYFWKEKGNEKFIRKVIQPMENAVQHLPKIWVFDSTVDTLCHGADLKVPGISKLDSGILVGDLVAVLTLKDELVALGQTRMISKDMVKEEKGVAVKTKKVFMLSDTYPKIEKI